MLFIVSSKIGAYRFTTQYSRHRLKVDQVIIRLELTEVELCRLVHRAACWEGTGGQVVWAGWAPIVSEWGTGGYDRVVDCTYHQ